MILCFSSTFEATRMPRKTDRAIFEKKPSIRLSQEPCFGVNTKLKRPSGWAASLCGFLGHVRRMIVQDDFDRGIARVGCVEFLEEPDEFARTMALFDAGMDLPGEQVDTCQQAQRPIALVFMLARDARVLARDRRQIGRCVGDRLDAWLLVIRDECDVGSGLVRRI